jgi:hypothetical protein
VTSVASSRDSASKKKAKQVSSTEMQDRQEASAPGFDEPQTQSFPGSNDRDAHRHSIIQGGKAVTTPPNAFTLTVGGTQTSAAQEAAIAPVLTAIREQLLNSIQTGIGAADFHGSTSVSGLTAGGQFNVVQPGA